MSLRRREFLKIVAAGGAMGLGLDPAGSDAGAPPPEKPLFSFGLIADPQYADREPGIGRYYRDSLGKLDACVKHLNSLRPDFVVQLGDLINDGFADFGAVLAVFGKLSMPVYHVVGNHDAAVEPENKDKVFAKLGLDKAGEKKGYYDFSRPGWRFIVLNGTEIGFHAPLPNTEPYRAAEKYYQDLQAKGARNAQWWNGALGPGQVAWLRRKLAEAASACEKVIVICHFPVYPAGTHTLWNDFEIIETLESGKGVVAYLAGHDHAGSYAAKSGIHYLTAAGMVETQETAYALVQVYPDRLAVTGFGREPNRVLSIDVAPRAADPPADAELVGLRMIWNQAPHNAFTDLVRFKDRWFCTLREGTGHVSHDGKLRVITSPDGETWTSAALLTAPAELPDLRDPKITVAADGRLMLTGAAALRTVSPSRHQTYAWFSSDGKDWSPAAAIGEPDVWLWRVTWHKGAAWGVGYGTARDAFTRLYRSADGRRFETAVERLFDKASPNEGSLVFLDDDECLCLLRRDGPPATAMLGSARPPYTQWTWQDLGVHIGGPRLIRLADGRFVAAGRRVDGVVRTGLMWLDPAKGVVREFLRLPSGGDTSYPGLVMHDGLLWVSYYASHEGKTSIYLAKVRLPEERR